jgi:hypothetical protein
MFDHSKLSFDGLLRKRIDGQNFSEFFIGNYLCRLSATYRGIDGGSLGIEFREY